MTSATAFRHGQKLFPKSQSKAAQGARGRRRLASAGTWIFMLASTGPIGTIWAVVGISGEKWHRMALTGTYLRTLDEKRRIAVPKRLKDDFGEANLEYLFIAPGTQRSLVLYSPKAFAKFGDLLAGNPSQQNYLRLFFSSAERVDLDGQSRIRIPDRLSEYASLKREVCLLGVQDHAELWDRNAWEQFVSTNTPSFDELAGQAYRALESGK